MCYTKFVNLIMQKRESKLFDYLLLIISSFVNGIKSVYAKKSNQFLTETHNVYTYNFYMFLISFLIMLVIGFSSLKSLNLTTFILGSLYAVFLVSAQVLLIKAMNHGGVSISSLFYSCGFLIPLFISIIFLKEPISFVQILGVILVIISFVIAVEQKEKATVKWFAFAISAMICNGLVGFIQKVFKLTEYGADQGGFMIIAFLVGAIITFFLMPKKEKSLPSKGFMKTVLVSGASLGVVNALNVYIVGALPAVVVFPSVNGGGIIAASLLARIFLKEKVSKRKKFGILLGLVAICIIGIAQNI